MTTHSDEIRSTSHRHRGLALAAVAAALAIAVSGCSTPAIEPSSSAPSAAAVEPVETPSAGASGAPFADCTGSVVASPAVTEGPYYVAGDFLRSDITEGQTGLPMSLTIRVVDTNCAPISGATVDIWHTNALGQYSGVSDPKEGCAECADQTFLRGSQVTNADGDVTFQTIFPGWYGGRTVHIHVKVWQDGQQVLTTQLFVDKATSDAVYASSPYTGVQDTTNESDRIAAGLGDSLNTLLWNNTITDGLDVATAQLVLAR